MIRYTVTVLFKNLSILDTVSQNAARMVHTTTSKFREVIDRKEMLKSLPQHDEGTTGEKNYDVDSLISEKVDLFPNSDTPNKLFKGIPFKDLPICNIRVSRNNTILCFTNAKGVPQIIRSCGVEGFKNTRKGTNVAAQATSITFGNKVLERGVKTVRVRVQGLGPGRMSAIKGLQMAGLDVVSITDSTRVSWNPPRARKQRKL